MEGEEAIGLVKRFLRVIEARDLDTAEAMMVLLSMPGTEAIE